MYFYFVFTLPKQQYEERYEGNTLAKILPTNRKFPDQNDSSVI